MAEEMPAAQGIVVGDETIRRQAEDFFREFSNGIARRAPVRSDKWYLDEGSSHSPATSIGSRAPSIRSPSFSIFPGARKRRRLIAVPFATRPCGLDPDRARPARRLQAPISGNQPRRAGAGQLNGAGRNTTALRPCPLSSTTPAIAVLRESTKGTGTDSAF
jgi:hypothetical protein